MRNDIHIYDYVDRDNPDAPGMYLAESSGGQWEDSWTKIEAASFNKEDIIKFINEKKQKFNKIEKEALSFDDYENLKNLYEEYIINKIYPGLDYDDLTNEQWDNVYCNYTDVDDDILIEELIKFNHTELNDKYAESAIRAAMKKHDNYYEVPYYSIVKVPYIGAADVLKDIKL